MNDSSNIGTPPGRYIIKNVQTPSMEFDRPPNPPVSSREYHSMLQTDFRPYKNQIDVADISRFWHEIWSKVERRKRSNEEAIRRGIHCASVWSPQQLSIWASFSRRRAASKRRGRKSCRTRMSRAEAALVNPRWAYLVLFSWLDSVLRGQDYLQVDF